MGGSTSHDPAAAMDRMYRRQRYIYDLTRKYYLLGRDRLIRGLAAGPGMAVLELGCGTARNLIQAARRYPHACFFGVDISHEMLLTARRNITRAGLSDRIVVAQGDATQVDPLMLFGRGAFDRIFISYSLSMIPPWQAATEHALTLLAARGELHIVDFGGQERLPSWFRIMLRRWLALFDVHPRDDLDALMSACAMASHAGLRTEILYFGYAQYTVLTAPRIAAAPSRMPATAAPAPAQSAAA